MARNTSGKTRKGSRHDRTGCLTCRYRRKKCTQNTFPVCGTCTRLNLECVREPVRQVVPPQVIHEHPAGASALSEASWPAMTTPAALSISPHPSEFAGPAKAAAKSALISVHRRYAVRYYVNELANHFSVSPRFNSFLSDFLPLAMQSPSMRESLISLALSHISLTDPTYTEAALESRAEAIVHLRKAIDQPQRDSISSLEHSATGLVCVMGLITTSDSQGWYAHMQGAKHFILTARGREANGELLSGIDCLKQTPEGRWVLRNFAYHDALGCVTLRRRPLMNPLYISGFSNEVDSYMGVATGLLRYIAEIQILAFETQASDERRCGVVAQDFEQKWNSLEKQLQDWECPSSSDEDSLESIAFAYRSASLILLYRLLRKQAIARSSLYPQDIAQTQVGDHTDAEPFFNAKTLVELLQSKISFQVSETVRHVSAVPVWSAPEAAILFPLFVAGAYAFDEGLREVIRTRLEQNLAKRKFQNISRAMDVLQTIWDGTADSNKGHELMDWDDVLVEMGWELVLT